MRLKEVWVTWQDRRDAAMLWVTACMCFFGVPRSGKVVVPSNSRFNPTTHLAYGDVQVDKSVVPPYLERRIKATMMDPFCQGVSMYLGVTTGVLWPVASILDHMVWRGPSLGPFFLFRDRRFLTWDYSVMAVRETLDLVGLHSTLYAGHSFLSSLVTMAALIN